jgi:hypothetical protein
MKHREVGTRYEYQVGMVHELPVGGDDMRVAMTLCCECHIAHALVSDEYMSTNQHTH